jgi:hypothetical protein
MALSTKAELRPDVFMAAWTFHGVDQRGQFWQGRLKSLRLCVLAFGDPVDLQQFSGKAVNVRRVPSGACISLCQFLFQALVSALHLLLIHSALRLFCGAQSRNARPRVVPANTGESAPRTAPKLTNPFRARTNGGRTRCVVRRLGLPRRESIRLFRSRRYRRRRVGHLLSHPYRLDSAFAAGPWV